MRIQLIISVILCFLCLQCKKGNVHNVITSKELISGEMYGTKLSKNSFVVQRKWYGSWIWLNKNEYPEYQNSYAGWIDNSSEKKRYCALFRKEFSLDSISNEALLSFSADVSCRIYINGNYISTGPANIGSDLADKYQPKHWFYSANEVSKFLKIGKNVLSAEVCAFDLSFAETTSSSGGFICDLLIGNNVVLSTDESWKVFLDKSFTYNNGSFVKKVNKEIDNWKKVGFNDKLWDFASFTANSKERGFHLIEKQIPDMCRKELWPLRIILDLDTIAFDSAKKEMIILNKENKMLFDFGYNVSGYLKFNISSEDSAQINIYSYEKISSNSKRDLEYTIPKGSHLFETPYYNSFQYVLIETNSEIPIVINDISMVLSTYHVGCRGEFHCSDTFFNDLWNTISWVTQLCMNTLFLDSPNHQEPIACTGDYLISAQTNYVAFGDKWLPRNEIYKTGFMLQKLDYDIFHTSYSLLWVQMLNDYYLFSGDSNVVKDNLVHINSLLDKFASYLGKENLLSNCPDYMFMDWTYINGVNCHHPPAVIGMGYMTAFYYRALQIGSSLNYSYGNFDRAYKYEKLSNDIKKAFNEILWDKEKKLYKDGIPFISDSKKYWALPKDVNMKTYSPHVNSLAVLYDIAPKQFHSKLLHYCLYDSEIEVQPYFMNFVLSAVSKANLFNEYGIEILNRWRKIIDADSRSMQENWSNITEIGYKGDYSHAWGGAPAYFLIKDVLGIYSNEVGYKSLIFSPKTLSLTWAKGKYPLVNGESVGVDWTNIDGKFVAHVDVPDGFQVVFKTPIEDIDLFVVDNIVRNIDSDIILESGNHNIKIDY